MYLPLLKPCSLLLPPFSEGSGHYLGSYYLGLVLKILRPSLYKSYFSENRIRFSDLKIFLDRSSLYRARFSDPKIEVTTVGILAAEKTFFILRRLDTRVYYYKFLVIVLAEQLSFS